MEIECVTKGMAAFPDRLLVIKNCPKQLYYIGDLEILKQPCVAVVGSRSTNAYGRATAEAICRQLAGRGVTIISGLARGIDTCAHKATMDVNGKTIAVLGCGLDVCYPPENKQLMKDIGHKGLLLSEYEVGTKAEKYNFPNRNRIISGLSEITVVVQAKNRSGSLITAELAAEQGREVMAVPGNIDSQYNLGTNKLIKEGATPIISVSDILEVLGVNTISEKEAKNKLSTTEFEIFKILEEYGEMSIDELCVMVGKTPAYLNPIIAVMEMKGFTFSAMGKIFLANM